MKARIFFIVAAATLLTRSPANARQTALISGPDEKHYAEAKSDYQSCRKDALKRVRSKEKGSRLQELKYELKLCKEQYPAFPYLKICKKRAAKKGLDRADAKTRIRQCHNLSERLAFNPHKINPLTFIGTSAFFAGAGLSYPIPMESLKEKAIKTQSPTWGNFSCDRMLSSLQMSPQPEHLLFGNRLVSYQSFGDKLKDNTLPEVFNKAKIDYQLKTSLHEQWGELTFDPSKTESGRHFFPVYACDYNRELGDPFESVSVYYLTHNQAKTAIPYFAVAFYRLDAAVPYKELALKLQKTWGRKYRTKVRKNDLFIVSTEGFEKFDEEGDPFDLCAQPRKHQYVATIALHPGTQSVRYFLLSNISNLCSYGDRLAQTVVSAIAVKDDSLQNRDNREDN